MSAIAEISAAFVEAIAEIVECYGHAQAAIAPVLINDPSRVIHWTAGEGKQLCHQPIAEANVEAGTEITSAFVESISEIVECYGCERAVVRREQATAPGAIGSSIGFADGEAKGSAVLLAVPEAIASLAPSHETDLRDWLGELNNQIIGRLKNKMVPRGLMFQLSPPVTVEGQGIRFNALQAAISHWAVEWYGGGFHAILALTVPADLVLSDGVTVDVAEEGSLNLF